MKSEKLHFHLSFHLPQEDQQTTRVCRNMILLQTLDADNKRSRKKLDETDESLLRLKALELNQIVFEEAKNMQSASRASSKKPSNLESSS